MPGLSLRSLASEGSLSSTRAVSRFRGGRVALATVLGLAVIGACAGEVSEVVGVEVSTKTVTRADGGDVVAPSGNTTLTIPPRSFLSDAQITVVEVGATDVGNAALSKRVKITSSAERVIGFSASLAFTSVGDLANIAPQNLVVGVGAPPFDDYLATSVREDGAVVAEIGTLGAFVLVDRGVLEGGSEPDPTPEGGPDEFGQCSASCLASTDQPCCLTCGGCASDACLPLCPSGTDWDCELSCCFNYDTTECAAL